MSFPVARRVRNLLLVATAVACVTACGSGSPAASPPSSPVVRTASGVPAGTVLNVGDQQQYLETELQASGVLAGAPYKVNFVEFNSGPLVDAGFAAHSLDIGYMGDLPASLAVQSGLPVKAVALFLPVGASLYLLARPGISSISQFEARQWRTPRGR